MQGIRLLCSKHPARQGITVKDLAERKRRENHDEL